MESSEALFRILDCPKLTSFILEIPLTDAIMDFIGRHPTLKTIRLIECDLDALTGVAPNVTDFTSDYNPSGSLISDSNPTQPAILPQLEYYTLIDEDNELDIEEFESLVKSRALPHLDPQSQLHPRCQPLKSLTIGIPGELDDTAWVESSLYKQARQVTFECDRKFLCILLVVMRW
ncbi:hypothetical protein CPB86DRAFT_348036 [Serendipita vermifera]|nr:hypothetical protein CPB86DRAFT_348036 [Serendipita vermifera]